MSNKDTGNQGETIACQFLVKHGYKILERNFRIRGGEIDIVASKDGELIFVEVKTRYTHEYGPPAESITPRKISFLIRSAYFYLLKHGQMETPFRLDAITVDFANSKDPEIEHYKNITNT